MMKAVRFILDNFADRRTLFGGIFAVALIDGVFAYSIPIVIARINPAMADLSSSANILSLLIIIYICSLISSYFIRRVGEALALTTSEKARIRLMRELTTVPLITLREYHSGYILSLVNRVCDALPQLVFQIYWWFGRGLVNLFIFFYIVTQESWGIALFDMGVIAIFVFISQKLSAQMLPLNKQTNEAKAHFASVFVDFASNITTVKQLGINDFVMKKINGYYLPVQRAVNAQQRFHAKRWFILHAVFGILFISTLSIFVWQVTTGLISVNIFIVLVATFTHMRGDMNSLAENMKLTTELSGYIDQIKAITSHAIGHEKKTKDKKWRSVQIHDVSFSYPGSTIVIHVPEFTLAKGEIIGISGPSGQGKSTILGLLAGHIDPTRGEIDRDGVVDSMFTTVSQEVELFNTSLRENLALGQDIDDVHILTYLEELDLASLVSQHPEGLDVVIGEKGLKLSAGQKQRVNIARAVIQDKPIILLDEPISHLDTATAEKVISFLKHHLAGKTALIVSHQPAVLSLASRIYDMHDHTLFPATLA